MKKILVIGGGFFGMYLAEYIYGKGHEVIICEKENGFMKRASYVNQARVHNGYHYPRSILTALRSRVSLPKFCDEFSDCINDDFDNYYMISKIASKTTAVQFELFCKRIGANYSIAPPSILDMVDPHYIEAVYMTKEFTFDAEILRFKMIERLDNRGIKCLLNHEVRYVSRYKNKLYVRVYNNKDNVDVDTMEFDDVFNCTYSMINNIIKESGLELVNLKHEISELAIVEMPDELKNIGITVMDGPFFSVMPFPSKGLHTFTHVRYTPHYEWHDKDKDNYVHAHKHYAETVKTSAWRYMIQDAKRFIPILSECVYKESMWEVKTVLPQYESNDSRPILYMSNHGMQGLHTVLGGKIDNVYDVVDEINSSGVLF